MKKIIIWMCLWIIVKLAPEQIGGEIVKLNEHWSTNTDWPWAVIE